MEIFSYALEREFCDDVILGSLFCMPIDGSDFATSVQLTEDWVHCMRFIHAY